MKIKKVYIDDWMEFKPYDKHSSTDLYYMKIANEVQLAIQSSEYIDQLYDYFDEEDIVNLSCFLTSYFEDIISETNVWNSFVSLHNKKYNKLLPFYDTSDYIENEINVQDIRLLFWYFFNATLEDGFVSPYINLFESVALNVFDVFDAAWEYAPENNALKSCYYIKNEIEEFYDARKYIDLVLFKTYLFFPDSKKELLQAEEEIYLERRDFMEIKFQLDLQRDEIIHNTKTKLLAIQGKEWAAEIVGGQNLVNMVVWGFSQKITGFFLYKGQDNLSVMLEYIATGTKFNITKKSFDVSFDDDPIDSVFFIGIVMWKNEWWFSGVMAKYGVTPKIVESEKTNIESKIKLNFLNVENHKIKEILQDQVKSFKLFNNGCEVAFLKSSEVNQFVNSFMQFYNESLHLNETQKQQTKNRFKKNGLDENDFNLSLEDTEDEVLVFINPNSGVEIVFNLNSAFPMPNNPFFKDELSEKHIKLLLMGNTSSIELVNFLVSNYKEDIPYFKHGLGKKYLEDFDFLLRFWKGEKYYSKPVLSVV